MKLSLDCLTLTNTSPPEVIASADAAGFDLVSLWFNPPTAYPLQLVTEDMAHRCAGLMQDLGIGLHSVEVFDLSSEACVQGYRRALDCGARLGGKVAVAIHGANPDRAHVAELLGLFVEIAGEFGLAVNVEPIAMGRTRTLAEARDLIRDAGVDAGLIFDTYHLMRMGGTAADVAAIEPGMIRYVQINDGPIHKPFEAMRLEAAGDRLYPGEGEFPLVDLLRAAPRDIPWAIETPSLRRAGLGQSAERQAMDAMASLQRLLDQVRAV